MLKRNGITRGCFYSVVSLVCGLGQLGIGHTTSEATLTLDERVFVASKACSLLQQSAFSSTTEPSPDLDGSCKNYLHKILVTDDRRQFDLETIEFVAQLQNGHTFFWDAWLDKSNDRPLGFYAMQLDGKWVVQTSFLDKLKRGDILSKLDDTTIEAFFLQQQKYISASSIAARRRNLFLYPYLFPEQFTLTMEDGGQISINRASLKEPPERTEGRWLKARSIAYVRIPAFFSPAFEEQALDYLRRFHKAETLIIDVRGNAGGIPPPRLISALMDRSYRGWVQSSDVGGAGFLEDRQPGRSGESTLGTVSGSNTDTRANSPSKPRISEGAKVIPPKRYAFRGRVILLVDGGCISACEDFVEPFKDSGRATLVGETTQGSSGPPFIYDFHNGMTLRIAVKRDYFPDGTEFEGVGIKPDVEVHTTIEDLRNGRDPVLERALDVVASP